MKSIEGSPIKNMDALPEYHHEPLTAPDALRILVLDPTVDPSTDLQGSIIEIRRFEELLKTHHQKPYSAVSYTWGEPNLTEDLFIHGNNESAPSPSRPTGSDKSRQSRESVVCELSGGVTACSSHCV